MIDFLCAIFWAQTVSIPPSCMLHATFVSPDFEECLKQYKMSNCLTLLFSDELFQDIATDYVMSGMPNGTHAMLLLPSFCGIYCYYSLISKYLFFQWIIERHMWCVAQIGISRYLAFVWSFECMLTLFSTFLSFLSVLYELAWGSNRWIKSQTLECQSNGLGV